jgi:hypothetical protein
MYDELSDILRGLREDITDTRELLDALALNMERMEEEVTGLKDIMSGWSEDPL